MSEKWPERMECIYSPEERAAPDFEECYCTRCNMNYVLDKCRAAHEAEVNELREIIRLILPLAKGYASQNDVGSNMKYVEIAEEALKRQEEKQ